MNKKWPYVGKFQHMAIYVFSSDYFIGGNDIGTGVKDVFDNDIADVNRRCNGRLVNNLHGVKHQFFRNGLAGLAGDHIGFAAGDADGGCQGAFRMGDLSACISITALTGVALDFLDIVVFVQRDGNGTSARTGNTD